MAGAPASRRQRLLAACLVAGRGAIASHRAAAAISELPGGDPDALEVTVPNTRRVRRPGIIVHGVGMLESVDVTVVDAIPVTTVTRTIIDLAAVLPADAVEEALDEALRRGLTTLRRLEWRIRELGARGRLGVGVLRTLIEARTNGTMTESVIETRLLRLLRRSGLGTPVCQHEIRDRGRLLARVDFAYPDVRVAIEVDGYRWHSGRARWEHDLGRGNRLTAYGWRVVHVTARHLDHRGDEIIRTIAATLSETATAGGPSKGPPRPTRSS